MILKGRDALSNQPLKITVEEGCAGYIGPISDDECDTDLYVCAGFLDIQVNGYRGIDYSSGTLEQEDVGKMVDMLALTGTTRHFPTIITGPSGTVLRNLKMLADTLAGDDQLRRAIPGVHLEGPFISPDDGPRGVHDPDHVRLPDFSEFQEWQAASKGLIRLITVAPERPGALEFIRKVTSEGVIVSLGHHAAEPEIIARAVEAGASLCTHLGNGSHANIPRLNNYIWEQLANDNLTASIIADGYHLPPSVLRVFVRAKKPEALILVSDVGPLGGLPPGIRSWGTVEVQIHEDGHLGIPGTGFLAGAGHLLDRCVAQAALHTDMSLSQAIQSCTTIPEKMFGLSHEMKVDTAGDSNNLFAFRWRPEAAELKPVLTLFHNKVWKGEI